MSGTSFCTLCRVAVHVFLGTLAQVYTRDATHRPTATSTPGRGAFLSSWSGKCRECVDFSQIFRNFPKKVKKSEKYPPPARAGGGFFGVLDPLRGVKFRVFSKKVRFFHFLTPPRKRPFSRPNPARSSQDWAIFPTFQTQNPPLRGGVKSHFLTFWVAGASTCCCIAPDLEARPFPQT